MRLIAIAATTVLLAGCAGVQLPHKKLSYAEACPGFQKVKCAPDDDPAQLRFNLVSPIIQTDNGRPLYNEVLGRMYEQPYRRGLIGRYCNTAAAPLFTQADIDANSATSDFEYTYKLKSELDAGADADLVAALTAAGVPPAATDQVKAAAKAAYNRVKDREVATTGRARLVRLKPGVIAELMNGSDPKYAPCREALRASDSEAMVKAMTVFHIDDASASTSIKKEITSDIEASLEGTGAENIGAVRAALERTVSEQIESALSDRYFVWAVTWLDKDSR